jgi:hypothetical protein
LSRADKVVDVLQKVEVAVQVAQRWILARLRNHRFFSLVELNVAIRRLLDELNMRVMRGYGDVLHSVSCAASTRARREKRSIEEANHATHLKKTTLKSVSHHQTRNESPTADAFRHAPSGITCFMDAKTVKNRGAFM